MGERGEKVVGEKGEKVVGEKGGNEWEWEKE